VAKPVEAAHEQDVVAPLLQRATEDALRDQMRIRTSFRSKEQDVTVRGLWGLGHGLAESMTYPTKSECSDDSTGNAGRQPKREEQEVHELPFPTCGAYFW
jgi:hypothetical protein